MFTLPDDLISISQESNTTRFVKVPPKSQNVSIIESDHVIPFKKEPALCLCQIKGARKWQPRAREKLERGRCGFELSVAVLMKLFGPRYSGLPSASVFSGLQTEQFLLFIVVTRETFHDS